MKTITPSWADGPGPHVVILGAGFGGLYAARALAHAAVRVTVVDRRNHHLFQPLLYQVATSALTAADIAAPVRAVLRRQGNARVLLAEATAVDTARRRVVLRDGELAYDFLLVATGSTHAYFGHDEWAAHAPGLKTVGDAVEIRRRILLAFEAAERAPDAAARRPWLTFVVGGGGPTGVELAGALREIAQRTLARDFRSFDPRATRVILLDAGDRLIAAFPEPLPQRARELLVERGVEVRTRALVTGVDERGVVLAGGERIEAATVLWAAGVQSSPLGRTLGAPLDQQERVLVAPDLSLPGHPEVFVIGDLAAVRWQDGWVPGMAPAAIQEGKFAARAIVRRLRGAPVPAFRYRDQGMLATIGRAAAVAALGRYRFAGFFAWVLWIAVHILWLIGFRNRVVVMVDWAWAYFTYQRSARVILNAEPGEEHAGSQGLPRAAAGR